MSASHTPGPWTATGDQIRGAIHSASTEVYETVAVIEPIRHQHVTADGDTVRRFDHDTQRANAALVAAAPDLLEALERLSQTVSHAVDRGLLEAAPLDPRTALDAQEWLREQVSAANLHARNAIARALGGTTRH